MNSSGSYKVRPAGRHLITIGRDLIQDQYAAVLELVKNAYDADSKKVEIVFELNADGTYQVCISDDGHGMSRDVVLSCWMTPSTDNKVHKRLSPNGRIFQGRKGVGRYASAILGNELLLETEDLSGEKTVALFDWLEFEKKEFLDEVEVLVETKQGEGKTGTVLTITGGQDFACEWGEKQFDSLQFELKKLISPLIARENDEFEIVLKVNDKGNNLIDESVEPYPIIDFFHYSIVGEVCSDGHGVLTYTNNRAGKLQRQEIEFNWGRPTLCGSLRFDLRVFDREGAAITSLQGDLLKENPKEYIGKTQVRQLLDKINGIGVYRNGFRIRPMGNPDFDWLKLNSKRVQNPSFKVGCNQVVGYVEIESEEQSNLIEKSARDGLKDNAAFENLKSISCAVLEQLETRRYTYRSKSGLSRSAKKVFNDIDDLFSFTSLEGKISSRLKKEGVKGTVLESVNSLLQEESKKKSKLAEDIKKAVAIYQGQATLGRIVHIVVHEGRRPLNFFKNRVPALRKSLDKMSLVGEPSCKDKIYDLVSKVENNSKHLSQLFHRIDPLSSTQRTKKIDVNIKEVIDDCLAVFKTEIESKGIFVDVKIDENVIWKGWRQDFLSIFNNLFDNSIYWLDSVPKGERSILIEVKAKNDVFFECDFKDTGCGILPELIEDESIFDPEFTTKEEGMGLGLAIAGESADRNGLKLKVLECENGAHFKLQIGEL